MSQIFDLIVYSESGGYLYTLCPRNKSPIYAGRTTSVDVDSMEKFLNGAYYTMLRNATVGTLTDSGARTSIRNLWGLGNQLYRDVVPDELKSAVADMQRGDLLHVFMDKPTIPWELVKNGGDFWGQLYVVSNSKISEARVEPMPFTLRVRKILNVIGCGIPEKVATRAKQLFQEVQETKDVQLVTIDGESDQDATDHLYEELPTADLIHFTGHGVMASTGVYLRIVSQEGSDANFMATSISPGLRPGCIVFANACISSETKTVIRQSLGFGPSFCRCGASAFIGALDLVPDYHAVLFAEAFYKQLFSDQEVGKALWAARQNPLKDKGATSLVPFLYSLYGNPRGTVRLH